MAYAKQTFTANTVLTSTQMNNVENNISDHVHGESGVSDTARGMRVSSYFSVGSHSVFLAPVYPEQNLGFGNSSCRSLAGNAVGNFAFGYFCMTAVSSGRENTLSGYYAGSIIKGNYNSGFGALALQNCGLANNNSGFGYGALNGCTSGTSNSGFGYNALVAGTGISGCNAFGSAALYACSGDDNCAFGSSAGTAVTSGTGNSFFGTAAGNALTIGGQNTFIGAQCGATTTTASRSTCLGYGSTIVNYSNATALGNGATVAGNNEVQLGNSATTTYAYGAVQNRSDARDKTDVRCTVLGLKFINALTAVDFRWDYREDYRAVGIEKDGSLARGRHHHGLIAQQVKSACDALGVDFAGYQDHKLAGGDDVLSIGYSELIAPLIRAVQELTTRVQELEAKHVDSNLSGP